jgi:hypothetical protein
VSTDRLPLVRAIGGAFGVVALVAVAALSGTALALAFAPRSAVTRGELALELASVGAGLGVLALLLGRHVAASARRELDDLERLRAAERERQAHEAAILRRAEVARASLAHLACLSERLDAASVTAEQRQWCDALACGLLGVRVLVDEQPVARREISL